jgi:hypothetical protein
VKKQLGLYERQEANFCLFKPANYNVVEDVFTSTFLEARRDASLIEDRPEH